MAAEEHAVPFVLGVLEELATPDALRALAEISSRAGVEQIADVVSAINSVCTLAGVRAPDQRTEEQLLSFLHSVLTGYAPADPEYGLALYALRGVGDETSLSVLSTALDASGAYRGARGEARRAIKKRLAKR